MYAYSLAGMVDLDLKSVRFAQNGQIGSPSQNVLKSDQKKSQICPIWSQSDQLWAQISQTGVHVCKLLHLHVYACVFSSHILFVNFCVSISRHYEGVYELSSR